MKSDNCSRTTRGIVKPESKEQGLHITTPVLLNNLLSYDNHESKAFL